MDTLQSTTANGARLGAALTTGLFAILIAISGLLYLAGAAPAVAAIHTLGYPGYFPKLLGVAKLLGAVALVAPGMPTLREWAYAGFTFNLLAAIASHALSGDSIAHAAPAAFALALLAASWSLRRRVQRGAA